MQLDYSFSASQKPYEAGQLYDDSIHQVDVRYAENVILFGQAVQYGTDPETQVKALTTGGTYMGIARKLTAQAVGATLSPNNTSGYLTQINADQLQGYPISSPVEIIRVGRVAVLVTTVSQSTVGKTQAWYKLADATIVAADADPTGGYISLGVFYTKPVAASLAIIQVNKLL